MPGVGPVPASITVVASCARDVPTHSVRKTPAVISTFILVRTSFISSLSSLPWCLRRLVNVGSLLVQSERSRSGPVWRCAASESLRCAYCRWAVQLDKELGHITLSMSPVSLGVIIPAAAVADTTLPITPKPSLLKASNAPLTTATEGEKKKFAEPHWTLVRRLF